MSRVSAIELRSGHWISTIINGYRQMGSSAFALDSAATIADMSGGVDAGVTTIDCGAGDDGIERVVGSFLQDLKRSRGPVAARDIRIHTRFVPDLSTPAAFDQHQVEATIDRSLARLGIETLDLVQLHWPDYKTSGCLDALGYLTLMQAKGKIRHIGVANFDAEHLEMFLRSGIDLVSAQVPFSLIDQRPRGTFADLCRQHDVALLAYGTMANGFLSDRWLGAPDPGYRFDNPSLARYRLVIEAFGGWTLFQELLLTLSAIAARHGVALENIALRAMHDHADVAAVILDVRHGHQLTGHLRAFAFTPTEQDRDTLAGVLAKRRGPTGPVFGLEREKGEKQAARRSNTKTSNASTERRRA